MIGDGRKKKVAVEILVRANPMEESGGNLDVGGFGNYWFRRQEYTVNTEI